MITKYLFGNNKKTNKLAKKFNKKKVEHTDICMLIAAMYLIARVVVKHELEITELKKTLEGINSKGA